MINTRLQMPLVNLISLICILTCIMILELPCWMMYGNWESQTKPVTVPFNNVWILQFKAQATNAFFCYCQSNVQWLLLASDYCRTHGWAQFRQWNSARQLSEAGRSREHLIDGSKKRICQWVKLWILESTCYWKVQ